MTYKNFDEYWEDSPINKSQSPELLILAFREVAETAWNAAIESQKEPAEPNEEGWIPWSGGECPVDDYDLVTDPDEEWISWGGGECPVDDYDLVDVKYRTCETDTDAARNFYWTCDFGSYDIIAYRLSK